jgi:putative endonuclease
MDHHARGKRNYCAGLAAEDVVRRRYSDAGYELAQSRWRGRSGEIDLIFRKGAEWVFAEVKASCDFARAAHAISTTQLSRILRAADEFLTCHVGHCDVDCRVDLALVDGQGRSHIVKNISMA